jgi:hypothetical protein
MKRLTTDSEAEKTDEENYRQTERLTDRRRH